MVSGGGQVLADCDANANNVRGVNHHQQQAVGSDIMVTSSDTSSSLF
jgi:hypothetical protein